MVPYVLAHLQVSPRGWILLAVLFALAVLAVAGGVHFMDAATAHQAVLSARYHSGPLALGKSPGVHYHA